ncbi:hypothetical protein [Dolosigranulum savutiense]|uniref:Uncharacterized protein n=1 Tax=Dolosigranulum savutiense TaxID=3110288 RepID=A0AB74TPT9_9LACT
MNKQTVNVQHGEFLKLSVRIENIIHLLELMNAGIDGMSGVQRTIKGREGLFMAYHTMCKFNKSSYEVIEDMMHELRTISDQLTDYDIQAEENGGGQHE